MAALREYRDVVVVMIQALGIEVSVNRTQDLVEIYPSVDR